MPPKKRVVKRWLLEDGWYRIAGGKSSHEQYKHPGKPGRVTLSGPDNRELPVGLWKSVRCQARWDEEGKHDV